MSALTLCAWLALGPPTPAPVPPPALPAPVLLEAAQAAEPTPPADPPALGYDPAALQAALARLPMSPTLAEVQNAALAQAGVNPAVSSRWLQRARSAAVLPTISVQYDRRFDQGWTLNQEVGEADALRNTSGNQDVLRAKATWHLERLIYSPDELRAARAVLDVADFRERLLIEITRLYFERERLLLERELAAPTDLDAAIAASLRLRELEGLLAGLTGLDFAPARPPARPPSPPPSPPPSR